MVHVAGSEAEIRLRSPAAKQGLNFGLPMSAGARPRVLSRTTALLALGGVARQIGYFAGTAIFAQKTIPADFGLFAFWYTFLLVAIGIADWGVRFYGWSRVAVSAAPEVEIAQLAGFKAVVSLVAVFGFWIANATAGELRLPVAALLGFTVFLAMNQLTFEWALRGLGENSYVSISNGIAGLIFLAVAAVSPKGSSVVHLAIAVAASNSLATGVAGARIWRLGWRPWHFYPRRVFPIGRLGLPYVGISILNRLQGNYVILLGGVLFELRDLAMFRIAHMLYLFGITFSFYMVGSVYSAAARAAQRPGGSIDVTRDIVLVTGFGVIPAATVGYLVAPVLIPFVFGADYADAVGLVRSILVILPVGFIAMFLRELGPALELRWEILAANGLAIGVGSAGIVAASMADWMAALPWALGAGELVFVAMVGRKVIKGG